MSTPEEIAREIAQEFFDPDDHYTVVLVNNIAAAIRKIEAERDMWEQHANNNATTIGELVAERSKIAVDRDRLAKEVERLPGCDRHRSGGVVPEEIARGIGGARLVRFFDAILTEQRKRWNAPDWRAQKITEADKTNWRDVAAALLKTL